MTTPAPWILQLERTFVRKNNLNPSELDVPHVQSPIFINIDNPETGDKSMKATFLFKHGAGNYQGSELFTYKTVNLNKLFNNNTVPVVWGYNPHTTKEVARLLIARYGLPMHEDWFVDEPIDGSVLPTHYTLKTLSTDWCSPGEITVRFEQSENDVAELFAVDVLDAPTYIQYTNDPAFGEFRDNLTATYARDFTPRYIEEKAAMTEFEVSGVAIAYADRPVFIKFIEDIIGDAATIYDRLPNMDQVALPGQILLNAYKIVHNGTTKGTVFNNVSADTSYDNVLIVKPVIQYNGYREFTPMFLHYNDV